jgi:hypothetical protein
MAGWLVDTQAPWGTVALKYRRRIVLLMFLMQPLLPTSDSTAIGVFCKTCEAITCCGFVPVDGSIRYEQVTRVK